MVFSLITLATHCHFASAIMRYEHLGRFTGDIDGFISSSRTMSNYRLSAIHMINPVDISIVGSKAFAVSVVSINGRFDRHGDAYDLTTCFPVPRAASEN